jgi:hypothetical protein
MAAAQRAYQQSAFRGQMADIERRRAALGAAAAAYGISLRPDDGKAPAQGTSGKTPAAGLSPSGESDSVREELSAIRKEFTELKENLNDLATLGLRHNQILKEKGLIPSPKR